MSATTASVLAPEERVLSPPIIYFWGPVRAHVNRVAAEYALRLDAEPIWLEVRGDSTDQDLAPRANPIPGNRRYVLASGGEVRLLRVPEPLVGPADPQEEPFSLAERAEEALELPTVVQSALRAAGRAQPRSAFVLSNIDRLPHLAPLLDAGAASPLLRAFRERGLILVLTSEGLLPLPHLDFECAFEVNSVPEEEWWEAEVRPGVPVSACASCAGAVDGAYGACAPEFRLACPVVRRLEPTAA